MVTITGKEKGNEVVGCEVYQVGFSAIVLESQLGVTKSVVSETIVWGT